MVTTSQALAIVPRTIDECISLAERVATSTLLPKSMQGKMPDVLVTIMAGQEMGLSPMASLRSFHVIEGKPVMSADGMVAVILGSGKAEYFERVEESDKSVTYETLRVGSKRPQRKTWTMEMARTASLHLKDNWRGYPRAMLASRAKSELARDVYPDVLAGCYTEDELGRSGAAPAVQYAVEQAAADADVIDAEIVSSTPDDPAARVVLEIESAPTVEALRALAKRVTELKLTGVAKDVASAKYQARMTWLRAAAAAEPATETAA